MPACSSERPAPSRYAPFLLALLAACSSPPTTPPPPPQVPTVSTQAATNVTQTTFRINGTVNPNGVPTTAYFEWGTDPTLATFNSTGPVSAGSGTAVSSWGSDFVSAVCGTTYYFRMVAAPATGAVVRGGVMELTTAACTASTGTIGPQGGTVATPSGATVTFSPSTVSSPVSVQARDTQQTDQRYAALSSRGIQLIVPLTGGAAAFQQAGSVQVALPLTTGLQPGATGYVRARFKGIQAEFWAPATSVGGGRLTTSIPSGGFADFKNILGLDTLDVVLDAEEFNPAAASLRQSLFAPKSFFSGSFLTDPDCQALPPGANPPRFVPCGQGSLTQIQASGPGADGGVGIVLVHGWDKSVVTAYDYYVEQGLTCALPTGNTCGASWALPLDTQNSALPGSQYFQGLLAALKPGLPGPFGGAALYVFDYQTSQSIVTSAGQLAAKLSLEKATKGLAGFVIISHSMGGLVARAAAQQLESQGDAQTLLGIIALATPHHGTPLPSLTIANWLSIAPGTFTPGGQSLLYDWPRSEHTPLVSYGGDIESSSLTAHGFFFSLGYTVLANAGYRANDGVVPASSALPVEFDGTGATRHSISSGYDHLQMFKGLQENPLTFASDGLYPTITTDLADLLRRAGAVSLAFNQQPSAANAGVALAPAVTVAVRDGLQHPVVSGQHSYAITISLGNNPTGATLSGTTTVTSANGVATFSDLSIDRAGTGYTLVATSVGLSATSSSFTVTTPTATIVVTPPTSPFSATVGAALPAAQTVAITKGEAGTLTGLSRGTITYGPGETAGWLGTATLNSTTTPATLTLQPNTTNLTASTTYHATVPITAAGGASGSVSVTYTVSQALSLGSDQLALGYASTCALKSDGSVYCWGYDWASGGRLFSSGPPFVGVTSRNTHLCGITAGGDGYCWNGPTYPGGGEIGDGTGLPRASPTAVSGGLKFTSLTAGDYHTCGLVAGGTAYCWGTYALGVGDFGIHLSPTLVLGGLSFAEISAGDGHTCGRTVSGTAYCWGSNSNAALGDGTLTDRASPTPVAGGLNFVAVTAGSSYGCGVTSSGQIYCWGYNPVVLFDFIKHSSPVLVGVVPGAVAVTGGYQHACVRTATGSAYCWGFNSYGSLGTGDFTDHFAPTAVVGGFSFVELKAGEDGQTCGRVASGGLYCWGPTPTNGSSSNSSVPRVVSVP